MDSIKWSVSDFAKPKSITLKPYNWKTYTTINVKVKGYVNDTIKIVQGKPYYDILLLGELDTIIQMDYYGQIDRVFTFEPFRATEGKIEINISL